MATNNAINTTNPISVSSGGTGIASTTAYSVICGGTTSTAPFQNVSGVGTSGQVLVSNGAAALPTWQTAAVGSWVFLATHTASSSANLTFTSSELTGYTQYVFLFANVANASGTTVLNMDWSTNNGSGYLNSGFLSGLNSNAFNSNTLANVNSTTTNPLTPSITNTDVEITGALFCAFPASAPATFTGQLFSIDTTSVFINCFGANSGTTTINNVRFSYSSGNISAGSISLYGIVT